MTTTDPEEAEFLRQILENPADDTVRVVYADWLDEHGRRERAEFIRVQVELPQVPACGAVLKVGHPKGPAGCRCCELRRRERVLLATHWREWSHLFASYVSASYPTAVGASPPDVDVDGVTYHFSRGFVSRVTISAAAFLGGECPDCRGHGRHGDFSEAECTSCGGKSGTGECGTGRTEGLAKALFRHHPIEKVTLSDVRRWGYVPGDADVERGWGWWEEDPRFPPDAGEGEGGDIPSEIFKIMWDNNPSDDNRHDDGQRRWLLWDDESIPDQELSTALVQYGRGLPGVWD